jgi:prepilin peptidase CpaA
MRLMAADPRLVWLAGFAGLMIAAAISDFRHLIIPNRLVGGLCVLWLLDLETASHASTVSTLAAIGCAAAVIVFGAVLFSRGWIGGGDVKLLAAAALWAGAGAFPPLLLLTGLLGGLLALFFLTPLGARITAARDARSVRASARNPRMRGTPVPYGVAIAAAGLLVTLSSYLG